jgi:hypothetical protein
MRKPLFISIATVAPLVMALVAESAVTQSVEFGVKYAKADKHKKRGGISLRTTFRISDDAGAKPPALRHITFRFPRGSIANTGFFKTCSPAALERRGLAGCPVASRIGSGTAQGDARPVIADPVDAKITLFNGEPVNGHPSIITYAQPDITSPITVLGELKPQRRGPYGYSYEVEVPPIPTLPGQPNASVISFDATIPDKTVKRSGRTRHFIEGPVLCNGTFFLLDGVFTYEGGITDTVYERFMLTGGPSCP